MDTLRSWALAVHAGACVAACLLGAPVLDPAVAQPAPLNARVVWVYEDRVYIVAADSLALEPSTLLTFVLRGKQVATAEVRGVYDGKVAFAMLKSGNLAKVKKLERLQILAERPAFPAVPVLRVAYPAPNRSNLLFPCTPVSFQPPPQAGAYRTEMLSERSYRLVRGPGAKPPAPWPDTILIRLFEEATDQEIALERGEVDVAVFWPGELSAHMRSQPRWQPYATPRRSRGVVAAFAYDPGDRGPREGNTLQDSLALAALDQEIFRGDLAPLPETLKWRTTPSASSPLPAPTTFDVDPSCPGHERIARALNRRLGSRGVGAGTRRVRLFYFDATVESWSSFRRGVSEYLAHRPTPEDLLVLEPLPDFLLGVTPIFTIGCPVLSAPRHRDYVHALGADAFADMLECRSTNGRP